MNQIPQGEDPTVIFLHIGKTAGSTVRRIVARQFPSSQTLELYARHPPSPVRQEALESPPPAERAPREESLAAFGRLPLEQRAACRLLLGHTVFGIHESIPRPCTYVTFLRDPYRLLPSQWTYIRSTPSHRLYDAVRRMSLSEFAQSGVTINTDNSQTRALSGAVGVPFGGCDEDMLGRAKENIDRWFSAVGITERFDESLLALQEAFGWSRLHYVSVNVSRSAARPEMSNEDRDLIAELNRFDLELYRYANDRLDATLAAVPDVEAALARLRRRNALYRPIGVLTQSLRFRLRKALRTTMARG